MFLKDFYSNIDKVLAIEQPIIKASKYYENNDPIIELEIKSGQTYFYYQNISLGDVEIPNEEVKNIKIKKSVFDKEIVYYYF